MRRCAGLGHSNHKTATIRPEPDGSAVLIRFHQLILLALTLAVVLIIWRRRVHALTSLQNPPSDLILVSLSLKLKYLVPGSYSALAAGLTRRCVLRVESTRVWKQEAVKAC